MVASTRSVFDRQLYELQCGVQQTAELVVNQIMQATEALQNRDMGMARHVDVFDQTINQMRFDLEEKCYAMLALQQPNSHDMRRIVGTVSVVTNLERMGDHAAGIARLILRIGTVPNDLDVHEFAEMAEIAAKNLNDAMIALSTEDADLARAVVIRDDQVDQRHDRVYGRLVKTMSQNPALIECATMLLWVSHNYERYADRISNICERVIYMVTGDLHEPRAATHHDQLQTL